MRINNHEQTDLQEYLGSYIADENGRLVFREGALVTAVRQGHWVVLDELNLAPSEVLEALNRWVLGSTLPMLDCPVKLTLGSLTCYRVGVPDPRAGLRAFTPHSSQWMS